MKVGDLPWVHAVAGAEGGMRGDVLDAFWWAWRGQPAEMLLDLDSCMPWPEQFGQPISSEFYATASTSGRQISMLPPLAIGAVRII